MAQILVVDDEAGMLTLLTDLLEAHGHSVTTADDGDTAVSLAHQQPPDLILCDVTMIGMDGYGVLAALRRDPLTAIVPVIFLTGITDPAAVRRGMEEGADDYLTKPVREAELMRAVQARLDRQADARQEVRRRLHELKAGIARALPHEFLTPLTAVLGLSSLLMDEAASFDANAVREVASGIFLGGQKLQQIITKFTLHAELEAMPGEPADRSVPELADAGKLIEEAARAKAGMLDRAADLTLEIQPLSAAIAKDHLRALVDELVENALTYSAAGSRVVVRWQAEDGGPVLSVTDHGRGMSPEQVAGLDSYVPSRRHDLESGIGLGLSIVQRLALLYRGQLAFHTQPGQGTTVRLRLPSARS